MTEPTTPTTSTTPTTRGTSTAPTATPVPGGGPLRLALGWAAIAGTLPYLTLKVLWLTGSTVGARDPSFLHDTSVMALNAATAALDLAVVGLALALTRPWGRRLPAWTILLPAWVGTGFLVPIAAAVLPATALSTLTAPGPTGPPSPLEGWVQPMVYGGFAWQGVFLVAAFALYARDRWWAAIEHHGVHSSAVAPTLRVVAGGGAVMATLSAALHLLTGVMSGDLVTVGVESVNAGLAGAGAAGVPALVRGTSLRLPATVAAWTGTAAMFSWGLYTAAVTMGATALSAAGSPVAGLARLTGLLGGFALAVAGLLALAGTGVARPR